MRAAGIEGVEMLGRHVGQRAPDHGVLDFTFRRTTRLDDGQVEIEQHRSTVGSQQDIRRLQVTVEQSPGMGVFESLGKPRHDPHRGLDGAGFAQEPS